MAASPEKADGCTARFLLLAGDESGHWGGALVRWTCGAQRLAPEESAVDLAVLRERLSEHSCLTPVDVNA